MKSDIKISLNKMFIDGRFIFIYQILYLRGPLCTGTSGPVFSAGTSGPVFSAGTSGPLCTGTSGSIFTGTSGPVFSAGTSGPVFTGTSGPVQNRKDGNRKHF